MSEDELPFRYDARLANEIELVWQDRWEAQGAFHAPNPSGPLAEGFDRVAGRPKFYVLDMFAYPSGSGLHVGHPLGYIATDVYARFLRMTGHAVLHAYGYDAFGLPAEQYAISTGQHPAVTTRNNIAIMRRQLRRLGLGHDTRREIATTDPGFYRWTQWMFLRIFGSWFDEEQGRARPVADLVAELEAGRRAPAGPANPGGLPWAELDEVTRRRVVDARRLAYISEELVNWCPGLGTVLADEEVTADGRSDVGNYPVYRRPLRQWMLRITAYAERLLAELEPLDWPEPVKQMQRNWIGPSDGHAAGRRTYRLRDWLFSRQRYWGEPFPIVYDSDGLPVPLPDAMLPVTLPEMTDFRATAPDDAGRPDHAARPDDTVQPDDDVGDPVPPLARAVGWADVELDLGAGRQAYRRELNTMPQWAGSCWYYLRYLDPQNDAAFADPAVERYWMAPAGAAPGDGGVDLYVGGVEQAVLHLLYARFWHKVLFDLGYVSTREPFRRLVNQGYILADAFTDARGMYVPAAEVEQRADGGWVRNGAPVTRRTGKMGKSLKNGVSPDDMYASYGADTLRLYEMAMGPLDADRPWHTDDVIGVHRFLRRLWRSLVDERTGDLTVDGSQLDEHTERILHSTVRAVRDHYAALRFNVAIARLQELASHASRLAAARGAAPRALAEPLVLMVAPLAPHIAEELWARLGHGESVSRAAFPVADEPLAAEAFVVLPVQVNGRVRFRIEVPSGASEELARQILTGHPEFARHVGAAPIERIIIVPGRMASVVTGPDRES
jgi:leucyl-tRNA synthetase